MRKEALIAVVPVGDYDPVFLIAKAK